MADNGSTVSGPGAAGAASNGKAEGADVAAAAEPAADGNGSAAAGLQAIAAAVAEQAAAAGKQAAAGELEPLKAWAALSCKLARHTALGIGQRASAPAAEPD